MVFNFFYILEQQWSSKMSLTNDYFLLYHGITFEQNLDIEPIDIIANEEIFTIYALILSATRKKNYEKFFTFNII